MAEIVVVGGANLDRILRLDTPLRYGGRTTYRSIETRWGGGGVNTGAALLALGHCVSLVARIAEDETGAAFIAALKARGFDTGHVTRSPGRTNPAEIIVEPSGERTILLPSSAGVPDVPDLSDRPVDLLYVNACRLAMNFGRRPAARLPVIAQLPLDPGESRPAHLLIASRSDFPGLSLDALRERAMAAAGGMFESLVVTDGARDVVVSGKGAGVVSPQAVEPVADTIGAGDFFAAGFIDRVLAGASPTEAAAGGIEAARRFLRDRPI